MILPWLFILFTSCSLLAPKPPEELRDITEEVIKRKEGVDIKITPINPNQK